MKATALIAGHDKTNDKIRPLTCDAGGRLLSGTSLALVSGSFARPANTDAYAAKDIVSSMDSLELANAARLAGGSGFITGALAFTSQTTCTARFRVHVFQLTNALAMALDDNAAFDFVLDDQGVYLGYFDLAAMALEGTGSNAAHAINNAIRIPFVCDAASTSLFVVLETLDIFTPASGQTFALKLAIEQH